MTPNGPDSSGTLGVKAQANNTVQWIIDMGKTNM